MTELEKLKLRIPEENDDSVLVDILESAKAAIMRRRYPFGNYPDELEPRYSELQLDIAVIKYNKRGVEGQTAHSENGVSRTYESIDELLKEVVPKGAVI